MNASRSAHEQRYFVVRAEKEGRSMQQVALNAVDEYLLRAPTTS